MLISNVYQQIDRLTFDDDDSPTGPPIDHRLASGLTISPPYSSNRERLGQVYRDTLVLASAFNSSVVNQQVHV